MEPSNLLFFFAPSHLTSLKGAARRHALSGVGGAVERHLGNPRPVALSRAALEVLAIVVYEQPIAGAGIERIRGSNSASALDTLLMRDLVALNDARLFSTTRAFIDFACLRDLADLPPRENDKAAEAANASIEPRFSTSAASGATASCVRTGLATMRRCSDRLLGCPEFDWRSAGSPCCRCWVA